MKYRGMDLISVDDHLPVKITDTVNYLLIFHRELDSIEGIIGFFDPRTKSWFRMADGGVTDDNIAVEIEDVTDWVDYWALMPRWMFEDDETFHEYVNRWGL